MTIRLLTIFIKVVDCNSMSLAAKHLYISQPSVSQAISQLENFYDIKLFERLSKKLYITEQGKQLLSYARHIVTLFDEMEENIKNKSNTLLKIGGTITVGTCVMSDIINCFNTKYPTIQTQILINNTSIIESKILTNELDIGIVEGEIKSKEIICIPVIKDKLVLICNKTNPFVNRNKVELSELNNQPFILREKGSGTRELFENLMKYAGFIIQEKWVCNNSDSIKQAVIAGHGLSVISERLIKNEVSADILKIVKINNVEFKRNFSVIYHKNKYLSQCLKDFIENLGNCNLV
ncbi:LysR family transcriptional regulator [Clostridium bowmanii]|uniref:LysR family transcriptional regulator n=1 Tax=Clostridium bowmanii TaxID=132925 RepID=UPI001C0D3084|nr:LysR family transcriptional regulator [Clostridium bowmanii]MBU3189782.1 LysR family transcriptional regulator [Clostridium bowmanii]MCA1074265.1 LysR family transcriptional regulator [Clostridium bowmanii]